MYKLESQNAKELDDFLRFIKEKKVNLYLEIGLYAGDTFKAVYDTLLETWGGDTSKFRILGIDMPSNSEAFKVAQERIEKMPGASIWWTSSTDPQTVEEVIQECNKWFDTFYHNGPNGDPVSLVFIDGDHSFTQSKDDFLAYKDWFEYVAFNDISPRTIPQNRKKHPSIALPQGANVGPRDIATVYHLYEGIKAGHPDCTEIYFEDPEAEKARGIGILSL
jgi:hypothetical protein